MKKPGLRKNSPRIELSRDTECCHKECLKQFSTAHLYGLREKFETLYYDEQNLYLYALIGRRETKKSVGHPRQPNPTSFPSGKKVGRPPAEESSYTFVYYLYDEKSLNVKVCMKAFCAVLGFGPKRLLVLKQKMKSAAEVCIELDRRGRHGNRPQKVPEEVRELVRDHIRTFPARNSHYSRKDNHGRTYLSSDLSIARLYKNFLQIHDPQYLALQEANLQRKISHQPLETIKKPLVSEHFYHDIFTNEFNIYFGYPRTDTCSTCDGLSIKIAGETDFSKKQKLEEELEAHKVLAQEGYDAFRYDQQLNRDTWSKIEDEL